MLGLVLCLCVDLSVGCSARLGTAEPAASDLIGALSCTLSVLSFGMALAKPVRCKGTSMEQVESQAEVILGVDTHLAVHVGVVIDAVGRKRLPKSP